MPGVSHFNISTLSALPAALRAVLLLLACAFLSAGFHPQWMNDSDSDSIELSEKCAKDTDGEKKEGKEERTIDDLTQPFSLLVGASQPEAVPVADIVVWHWFHPYIATPTPPPERA